MKHRRRHSLPELHRTLHRPSWEREVRHQSASRALNYLWLAVVIVAAGALLLGALKWFSIGYPDPVHVPGIYAVPAR